MLEYDFGKEHIFKSKEERSALLKTFFNATNKRYVMVMLGKDAADKVVKTEGDDPGTLIGAEKAFVFEPNPLVGNCSPLIKDSSEVSLKNEWMISFDC